MSDYSAQASSLLMYNWPMDDGWIGTDLLSAYTTAGTSIIIGSYLLFYILFSWTLTKLGRFKSWTVIYSNHKIFGLISLNKKNK